MAAVTPARSPPCQSAVGSAPDVGAALLDESPSRKRSNITIYSTGSRQSKGSASTQKGIRTGWAARPLRSAASKRRVYFPGVSPSREISKVWSM